MPINMARLLAMDAIQEDNQLDGAITNAVNIAPSAREGSVSQLNFGNRSVRQPAEQAQAIENYVPPVTNIQPSPSDAPPKDPALQQDQTLVSYLENQAQTNAVGEKQGVYSESLSNSIGQSLDRSANVAGQFQQLGKLSPQQRAQTGARFGAGLGAAVGNGPIGALIGSGVGAMAGRSLGMIQSGEHDSQTRRGNILNTLSTMGALGENLTSPFKGSNLRLAPDESTRLPNISGEGDRTLYDIDLTNPLSRRSTTVARPLARYIGQGLMNQLDDNGGPVTRSIDQTTGMLVNMFTDGAGDIDTVNSRARDFAGRLGIDETNLRSFFSANRHRINPQEANEIKKGLDTIYA